MSFYYLKHLLKAVSVQGIKRHDIPDGLDDLLGHGLHLLCLLIFIMGHILSLSDKQPFFLILKSFSIFSYC